MDRQTLKAVIKDCDGTGTLSDEDANFMLDNVAANVGGRVLVDPFIKWLCGVTAAMGAKPAGKGMEVLLLSSTELESIGMTFVEATDCCAEAFCAHGHKTYEMPPKPGVHSKGNSFIHAMPCYLSKPHSGEEKPIGIKWIAGYPDNPSKKLPTITGLMILNDPKTGFVKCVMDGAFVTNIRTAGATCAAFRKLGTPEMTSIGLVGAGMQGKWNVLALSGIMNLQVVKVYDLFPAAVTAFEKLMQEKVPGVKVVAAASEKETITDVDVVLTCTGAKADPFLFTEWCKPGCLIFPIHAKGWNRDALKVCDKFVVDDYDQFKMLTGGWYEEPPAPYAETGEIVNGSKPGRQGNEKIICINTGLGLHDLTTAHRLLTMIEERNLNIGRRFEFLSAGMSPYTPPVK